MAADWSMLPNELLVLIARRFVYLEDFVAFGAVCTSWRLAAEKRNFQPSKQQPPWLMLAERPCTELREFFCLGTHKIHRVLMLPEATGKRCFASHGWLLIIEKTLNINLVNPISKVQISFPHVNKFKNWDGPFTHIRPMHFRFIHIVALLTSISNDLTVGVIYDAIAKVAFAKPGDKAWKTLNCPPPHVPCADRICYKGQFYGIDYKTRVLVYDVFDPFYTEARIISVMPTGFVPYVQQIYLAESSGLLLVVTREGELVELDDKSYYKTTGFLVFELDVERGIWSKVSKLGNRALFLDHNSSFSIEVVSHSNCKANCIYFTDDFAMHYTQYKNGGGKDMGVSNMVDGTFEQHFKGESYSHVTPPLWIQPTLV